MKIRSGFVSNSSSSSFLAIGTTDLDDILEKLGINSEDDGNHWTDNECFSDVGYGINELKSRPYNIYGGYEPYAFGYEIEEMLVSGRTFPDIKREFIEDVKRRFDIDLNEKHVNILYGEIRDG